MNQEDHFRCLQSMYGAGPINKFYKPKMEVPEGKATIEIDISEKLHHSAGAVHGSVYFKMLDDAAFFAANSLETEVFVLLHLLQHTLLVLFHPVSYGRLVEW